MSLYSITGLDLPTIQVLRNQLLGASQFCQPNETICSLCRKIKREQLLILINHQMAPRMEDLRLICSKCRLKQENTKESSVVSYKTLLNILNAAIEQSLEKEALPLVDTLIKNFRKKRFSRKLNPESLIDDINMKLIGWTDSKTTDNQESYPKKTCQLIEDLFSDMKVSYIARLYTNLINDNFRIQAGLTNIIRHFAKKQKDFKLDILARMISITEKTNDPADVSKWIKKGLEGINDFPIAFSTNLKSNEHSLFSICRKSVQFRYVYDQYQKENESQLLLTEFPMNQKPFVFKISSFGYEDEVEIGLFYAGKNLTEGGYRIASSPLLYRFRVCCFKREQSESKRPNEGNEIRRCGGRLDKNSRSYSETKIADRQIETKTRKSKPVFEIEDEDELELILDYKTDIFKIMNRSHNSQIVESIIKPGTTSKYLIFPCVRLIGTRIMVTSLP